MGLPMVLQTEIKSDGSGIIKTTYLGTSGNDMVYGLKFDKFGYPYVMVQQQASGQY